MLRLMGPWLALASAMIAPNLWACGQTPGSYCINEVLATPPGNQTAREYIEIRGLAGDVIPTGTYFVSLEGDANGQNNPGDVDIAIDLGGLTLGNNGFLVILPAAHQYTVHPNAATLVSTSQGFANLPGSPGPRFISDNNVTNFERPSSTYLIIQSNTPPTAASDIDSNDDGQPDGVDWPLWTVIDSIGSGDSASDRLYGALNFRTVASNQAQPFGTTQLVNVRPGYLARFGDSTGSVLADWAESGTPMGGSNPNWTFNANATSVYPAGMVGKPLNHIGSSNVWVNSIPVITAPTTQNVNEDSVLTFNGLNANAISISDVDAGNGLVQANLSVTQGVLNLATIAGISVTTGANGSGSMQIQGLLSAINTALNGLRYQANADYNGADALLINFNDLGNLGTDGAKTASANIAINVVAVNDAPSFTIGANQSVTNDAGAQTVNPFATNPSAGPADEFAQVLDYQIIGNSNPGLFSAGPVIDANGVLSYTPNPSIIGTATISVLIHDNGGIANGGVDFSASQTFTITTTAPLAPATVTGFDDGDADDLVQAGALLNYSVTFSRNINGATVEAADFINNGSSTISIGAISVTGNTASLAVTASTNGSVILALTGEVRDVFDVIVAAPANDDTTVNVDGIAPSIVSITQLSSNPSNAATVQYQVTFSEAVSNVDADDFIASMGGGLTGASVSGASGGGATWTITVNTGSGDGTVGLAVVASPSINDVVGNAMAASSATGATYTIDRTGPTVLSVVRLDANPPTLPFVRFSVTFSEPVTGVDFGNLMVLRTPALPEAMVLDISGSGNAREVLVYGGLQDGTVGLQVMDNDNIFDALGNPISASFASGEVYNVLNSILDPLFSHGFENPL